MFFSFLCARIINNELEIEVLDMFREYGFGLLFLSVIFKTIAIMRASNQNAPVEVRKKEYKQFNIPANILILLGVVSLLYAKYFT